MKGKQHLGIGAMITIVFYFFFKLQYNHIFSDFEIIMLVVIGFIYPLLTDIDHKISKITWFFFGVVEILLLVGYFGPMIKEYEWMHGFLLIGILLYTATYLSARFLKHRGPVHTVQAAVLSPLLLFPVLGFNYYYLYLLAFLLYESHLAADGIAFKTSMKPSNH